jgi:hypothetical protein
MVRLSFLTPRANPGNANLFEQPGVFFQISANEALLLSNGERIEGSYLRGGLVQRLKQITDRKELIQTVCRSILSRDPSEEEIKLLGEYLDKREDRQEKAYQQIVWALLASTEFRFNY